MEKLGSFYRDNKRTLFACLMRMTGDYYLAGDIMQESFTRYLERYEGQAPNASLLFTIARNALFDHSRNRKRNVHLSEDPIDGSGSQENDLMIKQEYRQVIAAMQTLEKNERDILALAISDGLSYRDIAAIVDISVENVKVKVSMRGSMAVREVWVATTVIPAADTEAAAAVVPATEWVAVICNSFKQTGGPTQRYPRQNLIRLNITCHLHKELFGVADSYYGIGLKYCHQAI